MRPIRIRNDKFRFLSFEKLESRRVLATEFRILALIYPNATFEGRDIVMTKAASDSIVRQTQIDFPALVNQIAGDQISLRVHTEVVERKVQIRPDGLVDEAETKTDVATRIGTGWYDHYMVISGSTSGGGYGACCGYVFPYVASSLSAMPTSNPYSNGSPLFLHEWMHDLERFYFPDPRVSWPNNPNGGKLGLHDGQLFGYLDSTESRAAWTEWYKDFLTDGIENLHSDKRNTGFGLGPDAWAIGTPRGRVNPTAGSPLERPDASKESISQISQMYWSWGSSGASSATRDQTPSGDTLVLDGSLYATGIGALANSTIVANLHGRASSFRATIGLHDKIAANAGSVQFEVIGDGKLLYRSDIFTGSSIAKNIEVNVFAVKQLTLKVTDGGDGILNDLAVWGNAELTPFSGVFVSDISWNFSQVGWGAAQLDFNTDYLPLQIGGTSFGKGLGTHANSSIVVPLDGKYSRFTAFVGVDDIMTSAGSVIFEVKGDGRSLYKSGRLTFADSAQRVSVDTSGIRTLELITSDAGDSAYADHSVWGGAFFNRNAFPPAFEVSPSPILLQEQGTGSGRYISITRKNTDSLQALTAQVKVDVPGRISLSNFAEFPPGAISTRLHLEAIDNSAAEGSVSVTVAIEAPAYQTISIPVTIADDDIPALSLLIEPINSSENGGRWRASVTRNTPANGSLRIAIGSTSQSAISLPAEIDIPVGSSSSTFFIDAIDDSIADGNLTVLITATASGHQAASREITITDDDLPIIQVAPTETSALESTGSISLRLRRNTPVTTQLVASLVSDAPGIHLPPVVTIPVGSHDAFFHVLIDDNSIADGNRDFRIRALANGHNAVEGLLRVVDDETPTVELFGSTTEIMEKDGTAILGVRRNTPLDRILQIDLLAQNPSDLQVPSMVEFPAGEAVVYFQVFAKDDLLVNGDRLSAIVPAKQGFVVNRFDLCIKDDDLPTLKLVPEIPSVLENSNAFTVWVERNTPASDLLSFSFSSSPASLVTSPPLASFEAGVTRVPVRVNLVDNDRYSGDRQLLFSANASGFISGSAEILLVDDERPSLAVQVAKTLVNEGDYFDIIISRNTDSLPEVGIEIITSLVGVTNLPSYVVLASGSRETRLTAHVNRDSVFTGTRELQIRVASSGLFGADSSLLVLDDEQPLLYFDSPLRTIQEGTRRLVRIYRNTESLDAIDVSLRKSGVSDVQFPSVLSFPEGRSFVEFELSAIEDWSLNGDRQASIVASSEGLVSGELSLLISDDPERKIRLLVPDGPVSEGNGFSIEIQRNFNTEQGFAVAFSSDTPDVFSMPAEISFLSGEWRKTVLVDLPDDELARGSMSTRLHASGVGIEQVFSQLSYVDRDLPSLFVSTDLKIIREGDGVSRLTVRRNTIPSADLAFSIYVDDPRQIAFVGSFFIPAGSFYRVVEARAINEGATEGTTSVLLQAIAVGHLSSELNLFIQDGVPFTWTNARNRFDTNDDGKVSPLDALLVINDLNLSGSRWLGRPGMRPQVFIDVSGDEFLSAIDPLMVINFLNSGYADGGGEGEGESAPDAASAIHTELFSELFVESLFPEAADAFSQTESRSVRKRR